MYTYLPCLQGFLDALLEGDPPPPKTGHSPPPKVARSPRTTGPPLQSLSIPPKNAKSSRKLYLDLGPIYNI